MKTYRVDIQSPECEAVGEAANAIRRGELVVFPTETVYGLAAAALDEDAVARVFEAKGRDEGQPLPVQVASIDELARVAALVPEPGRMLAEAFWPGPLTLVLPKRPELSERVTAGGETVGVRVPDHPVALALLRELAAPIVATSANRSGEPAPTTAAEAVCQLGEAVSVVLDSGEARLGVASTVVDVSGTRPRVLRAGSISVQVIRNLLGDVQAIGQ